METTLTAEDTAMILYCLGMAATIIMEKPDKRFQERYFQTLRKVGDIHEKLNGLKQIPRGTN